MRNRFSLITLSTIVWILPSYAAEIGLSHMNETQVAAELSQLEKIPQPGDDVFSRVSALVMSKDSYSQDIQGRIAQLQCWSMPAERDSEYQSAINFADQKLLWARQRWDIRTESGLLACRGLHQQLLGNMQAAKIDYTQALVLARTLGDQPLEAMALTYRGDMLAYQGQLAEGLADLLAAHQEYESLGLDSRAQFVMSMIANTYRRFGFYQRAESYFLELESKFLQLHREDLQMDVKYKLAMLYGYTGEHGKAEKLLIEAERFYIEKNWGLQLSFVKIELANIWLNQGKLDEALKYLVDVRKNILNQKDIDSVTLARWHYIMALALEKKGEMTSALTHLAKSEPVFSHENNKHLITGIFKARARIEERLGRDSDALKSLKMFVSAKQELDDMLREQRSLQIRFEFDITRRELENQQLKSKQLLQEQQLNLLQERRKWQYLVLSLLLVFMGALALYQFNRFRYMRKIAMTDELTGIYNRRQIQSKGEMYFCDAQEYGKVFSLLLLDIDHFKQVNDQFGHHVGDYVLVAVAKCIEKQLRSLDRVGRNGGEEFLVVLPETSLEEAVEVAEMIRQQVALLTIEGVPKNHPIHVSIGCAQFRPKDDNLSELIRRADEAMYRAKLAGRNRVMRAELV